MVVLMGMGIQSCTNLNNGVDHDGNTLLPNATVTVRTAEDKTVYLQLDEQTTLLPTNMKKHPFDGKEVRALVNFKKTDEAHEGYSTAVQVNWIDSIRTKNPVPSVEENDKKYGRDVIEIVRDPFTNVEDGYLTLRVRVFGVVLGRHEVNLITGTNPDNPYELELRHNAHNDMEGRMADGYVAFRLSDLPSTNGKTVKLKVKWNGFDAPKTHEFEYKSLK